METERIELSQREWDWLKVLQEVEQKHLTQVEAAQRLQRTDRQVRRMLIRIREHALEESFIDSVAGPRTASWPRLGSRRLWRARQRRADFGPREDVCAGLRGAQLENERRWPLRLVALSEALSAPAPLPGTEVRGKSFRPMAWRPSRA